MSERALALRAHVLLRSRFTEDQLALAVRAGIGQFVILGAGLDTFAYRQPGWAAGLRIFEVDQPASQQVKRKRLAAAGIAEPGNLTFAAIDLETEALLDGLPRGGVALDAPTFVSWLGVSMYLTREAVDAVFAAVHFLSVPDAARYFAGRHHALAPPRRVSIAVATVRTFGYSAFRRLLFHINGSPPADILG